MSPHNHQTDGKLFLLHSRLFPFQFYITWENKHDKTEEWQRSLTTSLHCTAHVIDCGMYFTLHCIQRVHLLQSGVIYKPYGLTVSFCRQQIQSALMQKHVLSLRERQIQTSEQVMIISHKYTEIFTTQSEFCQFLNRFTRFCTMHILSLRSSATRPNISTKSWSLMCWTRWSRAINTPVLPTPALHVHTLHTCVSNSHMCKTKTMKKYCHLK